MKLAVDLELEVYLWIDDTAYLLMCLKGGDHARPTRYNHPD